MKNALKLKATSHLDEIQKVNLNYIILVRRMIDDDIESALIQTGISRAMCERIAKMEISEMMKVASSPFLICSFNIEDASAIECKSDGRKGDRVQYLHNEIVRLSKRVA